MAVAFEEIAAGVVDTALGPWALVLSAGAVAVALASRSARPVGRMVSQGVVSAGAANKVDPRHWLTSAGRGMRNLVAEARAEYEAKRKQSPLTVEQAVDVVARASRPSVTLDRRVLVTAAPDAGAGVDHEEIARRRDSRGRFVRQSPNGTAPA